MRTTREILRLRLDLGRSHREIGLACKKSPSTVGDCLVRFRASKLPWPLPEDLDDIQLERRLYPPAPPSGDKERPEPDWEHIEGQLQNKHVTLELLWGDYQRDHANDNPYQYTWFCNRFRAWQKQTTVTMRMSHKFGEKMFVDWAGTKIPIINAVTGVVTEASIFVAALGASSYTYAEAFENEKIPSWIAGHNRACAYFGGVPEVVVPGDSHDFCLPRVSVLPRKEAGCRPEGTVFDVVVKTKPGQAREVPRLAWQFRATRPPERWSNVGWGFVYDIDNREQGNVCFSARLAIKVSLCRYEAVQRWQAEETVRGSSLQP